MNLSLGFLKSEDQFLVGHINSESTTEFKTIPVSDFEQLELDTLLVSDEVNLEELELKISGKELHECNLFPIRSNDDFQLNEDNFEKMDSTQLRTILDKSLSSWTLKNNLNLMADMAKITSRLVQLWPNDRTAFFEELWYILKINLGARSLSLLYNDMRKVKEKNELIKVSITGKKFPNPAEATEAEIMLLKEYEKEFSDSFHICDWNPSEGQLTFTASLKKSPVLVMANVSQLSLIQKNLVKGLIENINLFLNHVSK